MILNVVFVSRLLKNNKRLQKELLSLKKTLTKNQGLLSSIRKEKDDLEKEWEKDVNNFNKGWKLAESGKQPSSKDEDIVWDGFRSKKYSILIKEIDSLKEFTEGVLEIEDSCKDKDAKILELEAKADSLAHELKTSEELSRQRNEEIERLQVLLEDWYSNSLQLNASLRENDKKVHDLTTHVESLEKILVYYKKAVLFGSKAKLLISNLVSELKARDMKVIDLASLLRIDIPVAQVFWDVLKGKDNDSTDSVKSSSRSIKR